MAGSGWAGCRLLPVLKEGYIWAEVTGYQRENETDRLTARVNERECTSGRDPQRFLHEPVVVETGASVTIYWTSVPPKGGQNCQATHPSTESWSSGNRWEPDRSSMAPATRPAK